MFKWVACLCAALYFTLLVFGEAPEGEETAVVVEEVQEATTVSSIIEEAPVQAEPAVAVEVAAVEQEPAAVEVAATPAPEITTEPLDAGVTPVAAVQDTTQPASEPTPVSVTEEVPAENTNGVGEIWVVTGSTVNLRAGATTQAAVLGRTRRGDSAEVIELLDNGWAKVYILESGLEAYMSAKFLDRADG